MRRFRAQLVVGVLALTIAACSSTAQSGTPSSTSGKSTTSTSPTASSPSALLSGPTHYPFTFTQPDGTKAVIKSPPTRIVTTDYSTFAVSYLAALGVRPIGGTTGPGGDPHFYTSQGIAKVDNIPPSSFKSLDLETMAAAHPDLIVGAFGAQSKNITQLEAIAPLVDINVGAPPTGTGIQRLADWYPEVKLLAEVLNRQPQFNAFVTKFQAAAAAVRPELTGKTVSVAGPETGSIYVLGPNYLYNNLLGYLGLTVEPIPSGGQVESGTNNGFTDLSYERVGELTGQYLMLAAIGGADAASENTALLAMPLIQQLPSVKAGRVVATIGPSFGGYQIQTPTSQLLAIPFIAKAFEVGAK